MIYLDYSATTPLRETVISAMSESFNIIGNPSSVHQAGRTARRAVEMARRQVAKLMQVQPDQVIFTSGATEANNMVFKGVSAETIILTSEIEHDCVLESSENALRIQTTLSGHVDIEALDRQLCALRQNAKVTPILVSVMAVNNETGIVQPISEICEILQRYDASLHCDAVQAVGKIDVPVVGGPLRAMSISAHKIGGPKGCGALIVDPDFDFKALIQGGGQERRRRSGTENLTAIVGFGAAAEAVGSVTEYEKRSAYQRLRDEFERDLKQAVPQVYIVGENERRIPTVSNIILPGIKSETQVMAMDLAGFAVSAGSACSSGKVKQSHVLAAMGLDFAFAGSGLRVSFGWNSNAEELRKFIHAYQKFAEKNKELIHKNSVVSG